MDVQKTISVLWVVPILVLVSFDVQDLNVTCQCHEEGPILGNLTM